MSSVAVIRARVAIEDELRARGLLPVEPTTPSVVDRCVGRSVLIVGDADPELGDLLYDMGYSVATVEELEPQIEQVVADTVLVRNKTLTDADIERMSNLARYSLVLDGCKLPKKTTRAFVQDGDLLVIEKWSDERPTAPIAFLASVKQRSKTATEWVYTLSLSDGLTVRATSQEEYPNGTCLRVACDGVVLAERALAALHPEVAGPAEGLPSSSWELEVRACRSCALYEGEVIGTEELVSRSRVDVVSHVSRLLTGFAGTEDDLAAMLPSPQHEVETHITRFVKDSIHSHTVIGVVLEPETPYKNGIWFSADTLRAIHSGLAGAIQHKDAPESDISITESFINGDGGIVWEHAKPGSWMVACKVSDDVFRAIEAGEYEGFSIMGVGELVGSPKEAEQ